MKKKTNLLIYPFAIIVMFLMLTYSCSNDENNNPGPVPVLITSAISDITSISATCGGKITSKNGSDIDERGVCWSAGKIPTIDDKFTIDGFDTGSFISEITGLNPNTKYFVRAYATNATGTGYGAVISFTTQSANAPVLVTNTVSSITSTTATCGGDIISDKGLAITARGVCWSKNTTPTITDSKTTQGTGTGSFSSLITGLSPDAKYYVRAYATNSDGTGYGNDIVFTTKPPQTITDIDGNVYHVIAIGTQEWLLENLKVTKYRNGDPIPNITVNNEWANLTTGAYCDYNNSASNSTTYGKLYNWFTINDNRNLAPAGCHIPSDDEWAIMTSYLNGDSVAGGKLKEIGITHWVQPNTGATNESGFIALPGGNRGTDGKFYSIGYLAAWWTYTEINTEVSYNRCIYNNYKSANHGMTYKVCGNSVRCIKDN